MASNLPYSLILTRAGITGMGLYSCLGKLLGLLTMKIAGQDLLVNDGLAVGGGLVISIFILHRLGWKT